MYRHAPKPKLYVSNLLPETEIFHNPLITTAICIDNLSQHVLALSLLYDGAATLLINLVHKCLCFNFKCLSIYIDQKQMYRLLLLITNGRHSMVGMNK
jgi:hypothetical protein